MQKVSRLLVSCNVRARQLRHAMALPRLVGASGTIVGHAVSRPLSALKPQRSKGLV